MSLQQFDDNLYSLFWRWIIFQHDFPSVLPLTYLKNLVHKHLSNPPASHLGIDGESIDLKNTLLLGLIVMMMVIVMMTMIVMMVMMVRMVIMVIMVISTNSSSWTEIVLRDFGPESRPESHFGSAWLLTLCILGVGLMKMMVIVVMIIMMMVISDHLPIIRNCADNIFPEGGNKKPRSLFPPTCDEKIHCEETGNYHALSCIIMNYLGFKQR